MNSKEKILKYLSGQMNAAEKENLEHELEVSGSLKKEFERYVRMTGEVREMSAMKLNDSYLNTILPRVREKLDSKPSRLKYLRAAYVLPITAVIAMILFLPFIFRQDKTDTDILLREEVSVNNGIEVLQEISLEQPAMFEEEVASVPEAEDLMDKAILNELTAGNSEALQARLNSLETNDLTGSLSEDEAEEIYNSLINKKIL